MRTAQTCIMPQIRRLAFVINSSRAHAPEFAERLMRIASARGVSVTAHAHACIPSDCFDAVDAICAVGGDGTLLGTVPAAVAKDVPVIGINAGKLGFTTAYSIEDAEAHFGAFLDGAFVIDERTLLECRLPDGEVHLALNDITIKSVTPHLARVEVRSRDVLVNAYAADGLIFCTPTGSTAYNLSAGGPLIQPAADVFAMTPICPHTFSNRSFIFDSGTPLEIGEAEGNSATLQLSVDGRILLTGSDALPAHIRVSPKRFKLIDDPRSSYFTVVRQKLGW